MFEYKRRSGQYIGSFVPYGYIKDPKDKYQLLVDEEAAVLFAIQQQVHLAVSYSELIARINTAPIKKSQSFLLDDLIAKKERLTAERV